MITTQDEHQELAHLRAEVHRLQADSSRAIAALAECIGERDDLKAKLESTKSQMVELKRAFLSAENDVCAYRNKLAQVEAELAKETKLVDDMTDLRERELAYTAKVEADAAAMRPILEEIARYDTDEQRSLASDAKEALKSGSGQRLLDELAELRRDWVEIKSELALSTKTDDEKPIVTIRGLESEIYTLRATAQRRLELLNHCECDANGRCPQCRNLLANDHKPDCQLAAELKEGK